MRRVLAVCLVVAGCLAAMSVPPNASSSVRRSLPRPGAVLSTPPLLRWRPVAGARLYNVQVWRDGRKVLSRWPTRPRFQLRWAWTYSGHRYRLRPAVYQWYVWPWFGSRYGRLRVRSYFIRGVVPTNIEPPTLAGDVREGLSLTASSGIWGGTRPIRFSYSWRRCDPAGTACTEIAAAHTAGYRLGATDVGKTVRVVVTATNLARSRSAVSAASAVVLPARPANVSPPTIWGPLQQGETLIAANGAWTSSAPVSYSFAWRRCNLGATTCRVILGATGQAYELTALDFERRVQVVVTARNAGGASKARSAVSPAVGRVFLGSGGNDIIVGSRGADLVRAGAGADYVHGHEGNDRLRGGAGQDRLLGGRGKDSIFARDRSRDSIDCGSGSDRVVADRFDRVSNCEIVLRG